MSKRKIRQDRLVKTVKGELGVKTAVLKKSNIRGLNGETYLWEMFPPIKDTDGVGNNFIITSTIHLRNHVQTAIYPSNYIGDIMWGTYPLFDGRDAKETLTWFGYKMEEE